MRERRAGFAFACSCLVPWFPRLLVRAAVFTIEGGACEVTFTPGAARAAEILGCHRNKEERYRISIVLLSASI